MQHVPPPVPGVGEEAYWTTNIAGGILYVLKGEKMLRISVGGPGTREAKLEKSKAVAQKALDHLP